MNKSVIAVLVLAGLIGLKGWCATTQANSVGVIRAALESKTRAAIQASTATMTYQLVACTDCGIPGAICISTGTTAFFQFILSTGTPCR